MPRVKRGTSHVKKRRKLLKAAKGFKWGRKKSIRLAKTAVTKAGAHAYRDRKLKKRTNRRLWQIRLNAAVREYDLSYSKFIDLLKKNKIELDRKVLSEIAVKNPEIFKKIIDQLKK
jgi:large subunit ribosomal protein L20